MQKDEMNAQTDYMNSGQPIHGGQPQYGGQPQGYVGQPYNGPPQGYPGAPVQGYMVPAQAMPVSAHPAAGMPMNGMVVMTPQVDPQYQLNEDEVSVMSYRGTIKCLAIIDIVFTILGIFSGDALIFVLVMLIGPYFGYQGAKWLKPCQTMVYLVFCVCKTIGQIIIAFTSSSFWLVIFALIQIYITRIVWSFQTRMRRIGEDRLEVLRDPDFINRAIAANQDSIRFQYY